MMITQLKKDGRKTQVWLNDEPAFSLYPKEISEYGLEVGMELPEEERSRIYREVLVKRARLRSLYILKSHDRTQWQLRQKLREDGYPAPVIEDAVAYVRSYHYIDDVSYAVSYIESRKETKSRLQMKADLVKKGIADQDIETAFEQAFGQEDQMQAIRYWIRKKQFDPENADEAALNKFIRFLAGKGFSFEDIRRCLLQDS